MDVPTIEADFENGLRQSQSLIAEYLVESDKGSNILEIGCSVGYFLKLIADFGCNPYGVELSQVRSDYVNSVLGIPCDQNLVALENRGVKFRKIFMLYVLEYIVDPVDYLQRLVNLLEEGGELVCLTPSLNDPLKEIWRNKGFIDFFYDENAVSYITPVTINRILAQMTFGESKVETWQGYSFASHLSWYFTQKPRTTGIVGGDRFVSDIAAELRSNNSGDDSDDRRDIVAQKLAGLIERMSKEYSEILEEADYGNQIRFTVTR
jgi:SAM-dependent methyltransferase